MATCRNLVKEFAAEYHRELNGLNTGLEHAHALKKDELARIERQIRALMDAIKDCIRTPTMMEELSALQSRKVELAAALEHAPASAPRFHPRLAEIYRLKVANLQEELNQPELRAEAVEAIRSLVEEIKLVPESGRLEIELAGDLAESWLWHRAAKARLTARRAAGNAGCGAPQPTRRIHPYGQCVGPNPRSTSNVTCG